jgi:hypothetical protein
MNVIVFGSYQSNFGADLYIYDESNPSGARGSNVTCIATSNSKNYFCNGRNKIFEKTYYNNTNCKTNGFPGSNNRGPCKGLKF